MYLSQIQLCILQFELKMTEELSKHTFKNQNFAPCFQTFNLPTDIETFW